MGLKMLMCARIYPQWALQMEFLALSILVRSMETQIKIEMSMRRMPPISLMGRKTASIFIQVRISQL